MADRFKVFIGNEERTDEGEQTTLVEAAASVRYIVDRYHNERGLRTVGYVFTPDGGPILFTYCRGGMEDGP